MVRSRDFDPTWALSQAVAMMTSYLGQHATHPVVEIMLREKVLAAGAENPPTFDPAQLVIHDYGSR